MKYKVIFLLISLVFSQIVVAGSPSHAVFNGFKKRSHSANGEIRGAVREVKETNSEFEILVGNYAAFYRFPKKDKQQTSDLKIFLANCRQSKKSLRAEVNFLTREIIVLAEASP